MTKILKMPNYETLKILKIIWRVCSIVFLSIYLSEFNLFRDYLYYDIETNYLHWSSKLPAISVCQDFFDSRNFTSFVLESKLLRNLLKPGELYCKGCPTGKRHGKLKISALVKNVMLPCDHLLTTCTWNRKTFECCERFKKIITRKGICYSVNSEINGAADKFEVSFFSNEGTLGFDISTSAKVHLHEVRDVELDGGIPLRVGERLEVLYSSREIIADKSSSSLNLDVRGCILQKESHFDVYSASLCLDRCTAKAQNRFCNCTHYFLQRYNITKECDIDGMVCLDKFRSEIDKSKSLCNCKDSCEEIRPKMLWKGIKRYKGRKGQAKFILASPPTERLVMKSKTNFLERLVILSCISRWFTNFSLLHIPRIITNLFFYPQRMLVFDKDILY